MVIVSYVLNGGGQQNVYMTASNGQYTYSIPVVAGAAESLSYNFTYDLPNGSQTGPTQTYTWSRGN